MKENELLRTRGGEAILALQWRERYEVENEYLMFISICNLGFTRFHTQKNHTSILNSVFTYILTSLYLYIFLFYFNFIP